MIVNLSDTVFPPSAHNTVEMVCNHWRIPSDCLIIFSPMSPYSISSRKPTTDAEFEDLLATSGGTHGHAKLYLLEISEGEELVPDVSCFEPLSEWVGFTGGCPLLGVVMGVECKPVQEYILTCTLELQYNEPHYITDWFTITNCHD